MDLLSSIRKEGSRGGVNFSWSDVTTSQHRENYLGHSIMAPVGRWQKGKDLSWYAKSDNNSIKEGETIEDKRIRERKEEIRRIKDAEEDALARALGLPVKERNTTGSNAITLGEVNKAVREAGVGEDDEIDTGSRFKIFSGQIHEQQEKVRSPEDLDRKYVKQIEGRRKKSRSPRRERRSRRNRNCSRSPERRNNSKFKESRTRYSKDESNGRRYSGDLSRRINRSESYDRDVSRGAKDSRRKIRRSKSPILHSHHHRKARNY
ncbi:putative kinase phosphorylation protein [Erysiphe necator]|uniref:Putative kinase phosphorylation protein n=1 Tax=Uncinula necator TaxID=52586 RepID=A0A0B1PCQ9_UNCNE|nr:putative kinase phosphorylation protein [Erysiphe necator]